VTRTIRVRAAVAVTPDGRWCVVGWQNSDGEFDSKECAGSAKLELNDEALVRWIEADVPAYDSEPTIEAKCLEGDR
jgi:hypothetical protein